MKGNVRGIAKIQNIPFANATTSMECLIAEHADADADAEFDIDTWRRASPSALASSLDCIRLDYIVYIVYLYGHCDVLWGY